MSGTGHRKSLRTRFTAVLFVVGVVPLLSASVFFYYTAREAFFKNVFKELEWTVEEVYSVLGNHFTETAKDLLNASHNTAFKMFFIDPENQVYWVREQNKTLRYLRGIYPDIIDEACFIDASGQEVSRIVFDEVAHEHELSSEEDRNQFFKEAFLIGEGEVYQGRPTLSEDTHRWVLPNATPIVIDGEKRAILHFEVTMTYFQRLLKKVVNPDRGFAFILNDAGEFMAHTGLEISETRPFPAAIGTGTPEGLRDIYTRMTNGESGIENYEYGGEEFYIIFRPARLSYWKGRNDNRWSLAYVLPSEHLYVEYDLLRYNLFALGGTLAFAVLLAYTMGNYITRPIRELARATGLVAEGKAAQVEVSSEDELGALSESFNRMAELIRKRDEELKELATTDGLTGLYNYRYFRAELERNVKSATRFGRPLALIMADVDYFKHYNDSHGHTQGDAVLRKVGELLMKTTRAVDLAARYGGEEFAVLLPETGVAEAVEAAERIRACMEEEVFPFDAQQPNGNLTISIGVAEIRPGAEGDADTLVEDADRMLYKAKRNGRNRVEAGPGKA